jgi:hypothetical protein
MELLREELQKLKKPKSDVSPPSGRTKSTSVPPKVTHTFENEETELEIPHKYFDKKMVLHPKYAEKLHKKGVTLHPHHYDKKYSNKLFYTKVGKGIGSWDLQKLLKQSYTPQLGNVGDFMVDDEISNPTTQVYRNKNTDKVYVVHRGTKGGRDWLNNFVYGLSPSLYKYTDRYKNAEAVQKKALEKYRGYDIDVLGHSQGSKLAEMLSKDNKNVKNIITYNRPQGLMENLTSKPKNLYDIKTSKDLVSPLIPYQRDNQNTTVIPSKTNDFLHEHKTERILELPDHMIGKNITNQLKDKRRNNSIMRNLQGGTLYRSMGEGFMVNNVEHYTPNEALIKNTKLLTGHVLDEIKHHKALAKEAKTTLKRTKSMNKASLKQSLKGSQTMKDRMAKLRAMKKK